MNQEEVQAAHSVKKKESLPFSVENAQQQILGPDGKPCRACTDFKSWANQMKGGNPGKSVPSMASANIDSNGTDKLHTSDADSARMNVTTAATKDEFSATAPPKDCPVDKNELGRNTWSFLHTMAAYYPEEPTKKQQKDMNSFVKLFSRFYPCDWCSYHMRERLRTEDPDTSSNKALSLWFCDYHNEVNRRLGKKEFDCSKVFERWKDGWADGSCD